MWVASIAAAEDVGVSSEEEACDVNDSRIGVFLEEREGEGGRWRGRARVWREGDRRRERGREGEREKVIANVCVTCSCV